MRWPFATFIATLVVLHFFLHLGLGLGGAAPDLLTVAALLAARRMNRAVATLLGGVLGLIRDALALVAFGADALALAFVAYVGARTRDLFVGDSWLFVLLYLFVGKWSHDALHYGFTAVKTGSGTADAFGRLVLLAPEAALYSALAGAVALAFYRNVSRER